MFRTFILVALISYFEEIHLRNWKIVIHGTVYRYFSVDTREILGFNFSRAKNVLRVTYILRSKNVQKLLESFGQNMSSFSIVFSKIKSFFFSNSWCLQVWKIWKVWKKSGI